MAASSTIEVDLMLKKAIELLHSPDPSSATEMRLMLDELILQRFGPERMLSNTLTQMQLDEEKNFPGMMSTPIHVESMDTDEIINLTHSPAKTISDSDSDNDCNVRAVSVASGISATVNSATLLTDVTAEDDGNLKEFGDLNCCVCGEMVFTATNRLIECSTCGALYHQECHKPPISDEEAIEDHEHNWQCDNCCNKPSTSKVSTIQEEPVPLLKAKSATSSRSSSTSNSSTSLQKQEPVPVSVSSKHHRRSSKSSREERSSSSKHTSVEKSSSSSKRSSHSSSSSRSKSSKHESSSSKRKSNK